MGKIVKYNQHCIRCESSDAMQVYEDGAAKCFSCQGFFTAKEVAAASSMPAPRLAPPSLKITRESIEKMTVNGFMTRNITKRVAEFYGVKSVKTADGEIKFHAYPYGDTYKVRVCASKTFYWVGPRTDKLFGQDKFEPGGRRLVIVEGEADVMAMQQANIDHSGMTYPVVGVPSATDTACLIAQRDWIRSFREVVVFMDNDEAGQAALKQALRIIGYDKCRVMHIAEKDVNDLLLKEGGAKSLISAMWNATEFVPAGIVTRDTVRAEIIKRANTPNHPYANCLAGVNKKVNGKRGGEITLFVSGTGCGKSTILREEMLNVLENTEDKLGIVSLEEAVGETGRNLAAMQLNINRTNDIPLAELLKGFDEVFKVDKDGEDRVLLLDHQGAITDSTIMDQLEYMCLKGCKYLFIDHITILVSEGVEGLTGNEAQDKVMNDLLRLVKKYPDVWIGLVSHLRKTGVGGASFETGRMPQLDDIKGSGAIKQISFDIIAFARNTTADDPMVRNTIEFSVLKSRWSGDTGPAGGAVFDSKTGRVGSTDVFMRIVS